MIQYGSSSDNGQTTRSQGIGHRAKPFRRARDQDNQRRVLDREKPFDDVKEKPLFRQGHRGQRDHPPRLQKGAQGAGHLQLRRRNRLIEPQLPGHGDVPHPDQAEAVALQVRLHQGPGITLHQLVTQLQLRIPIH